MNQLSQFTQRLEVRNLCAGKLKSLQPDEGNTAINLVAIVDSRREMPETDEENNAGAWLLSDVKSVDVAITKISEESANVGAEIGIAGEGFDQRPGHHIDRRLIEIDDDIKGPTTDFAA